MFTPAAGTTIIAAATATMAAATVTMPAATATMTCIRRTRLYGNGHTCARNIYGSARVCVCNHGTRAFSNEHPAVLLKRVCCPTVDEQNPAPPFELPPATPIFNIDRN